MPNLRSVLVQLPCLIHQKFEQPASAGILVAQTMPLDDLTHPGPGNRKRMACYGIECGETLRMASVHDRDAVSPYHRRRKRGEARYTHCDMPTNATRLKMEFEHCWAALFAEHRDDMAGILELLGADAFCVRAAIPADNRILIMEEGQVRMVHNDVVRNGDHQVDFTIDESTLEDMDRLGVDVQALSPNPGQYYYFTPPELGRDLARITNDGIAEAVAQAPDRLVGIGTVPLQDVDMAIAEMRRCVDDCGMRGIEIGTSAAGRELADATLRPFFAAAEELGILLLMHPLGFTQGGRLSEHYLNNIIGNPLEATIALSHLIFGGVLDSYPGLKMCVVHGGGFLSGYWGRMDHAWRARADCRQHIDHAPSSYLRQIWFDTLVFDRKQLTHLVDSQGADRLCLGSDYPFDMGELDPVGMLSELPEEVQVKLLGTNAAGLLGLAPVVTNKAGSR